MNNSVMRPGTGRTYLSSAKMGEMIQPRRTYPARQFLRQIPNRAAYIVRVRDLVLYVGSTGLGVATRLRQHTYTQSPLGRAIKSDPHSKEWDVEMVPAPSRHEALQIEADLIHLLRPVLNVKR